MGARNSFRRHTRIAHAERVLQMTRHQTGAHSVAATTRINEREKLCFTIEPKNGRSETTDDTDDTDRNNFN